MSVKRQGLGQEDYIQALRDKPSTPGPVATQVAWTISGLIGGAYPPGQIAVLTKHRPVSPAGH